MNKSLYMSVEKNDEMKARLLFLLKTDRPETVLIVTEAAAQGDRSENADYLYNKKKLRQIDGEIRRLQKKLAIAVPINVYNLDCSKVRFGQLISVENLENGEIKKVQLLGTEEVDPINNVISLSSPLGRALLGKERGDEVSVKAPNGVIEYCVCEIETLKR